MLTAECVTASHQHGDRLHHRVELRRCAKGKERSAYGPDKRVDTIPDRREAGNFVGDKLGDVHHACHHKDGRVRQHFQTRRQRTQPAEALGDSHGQYGGVQIDA
jgi:hypothetical protein